MTEEEIKALQDAKEEAERRASEAEALAEAKRIEAEKERTDKLNLVEELKTERLKKNEALSKANINGGQVDIQAAIDQELERREQERVKSELASAIDEFKSSKTEFSKDTSGLVFNKFQEQLKMFNFNGLRSKEEFKQLLEKVYRFSGTTQQQQGSDYEGMPASGAPAPISNSEADRKVDTFLEKNSINKDTFSKIKTKYPGALEGLGM